MAPGQQVGSLSQLLSRRTESRQAASFPLTAGWLSPEPVHVLSPSLVTWHNFMRSKSSQPPSMRAITILNEDKRKLRFRNGNDLPKAFFFGSEYRIRI